MRFLSQRDVSGDRKDAKRTPEVIALGLPRCATSSLQEAFEKLGCKPCMHMAEVAPYADKLKLCGEAMQLLYPEVFESGRARRQEILHQLFDGWAASSDFPGMLFVEDLMDMYPDAKIILNQREPESWSRSMQRTLSFFASQKYAYVCALWQTDRLHYKIHDIFRSLGPRLYKVPAVFEVPAYHAHIERVRKAAEARNRPILEWKPAMGWQPICDLLDKPVPKNEPFPHANDEATIKLLCRVLLVRGALSWAALLGGPFLAYWLASRQGSSWQSLLKLKFW